MLHYKLDPQPVTKIAKHEANLRMTSMPSVYCNRNRMTHDKASIGSLLDLFLHFCPSPDNVLARLLASSSCLQGWSNNSRLELHSRLCIGGQSIPPTTSCHVRSIHAINLILEAKRTTSVAKNTRTTSTGACSTQNGCSGFIVTCHVTKSLSFASGIPCL